MSSDREPIEVQLAGWHNLPDDMSEAFESFKLSIIRHKLAGWQECRRLDALDAVGYLADMLMRKDEA